MNDQRHGMGTYSSAGGQSWTGEWQYGKQFKKVNDMYGTANTGMQSLSTISCFDFLILGRSTVFHGARGEDVGYGEFTASPGHPFVPDTANYGDGVVAGVSRLALHDPSDMMSFFVC